MRAISVLVVERSPAEAAPVIRELERTEWIVDHQIVSNERRLMEELSDRKWDLVISEYSMPGLHALTALNLVKAEDESLPFICVSSNSGEEAALSLLQAGADDFLIKGKLARLPLSIERAVRDASERKARREAELAAQRSEARLRAVIESMGDTVFTVDLELRHDRIFGRRATPAGFASTRLLGRTPLEIWHAPLGTAMQAAMKRALTGERTLHEWSVELPDATLHFQTCLTALKSESGQTIGVVGTERDVTQQKLTDARLLAADRMASVGMLASGIAHEIKNPLAALSANVELALGEAANVSRTVNGAQQAAIERLLAELTDADECSDRIRHVVHDLDALTQIEVPPTTAVDVNAVLETALRITDNQTRHAAKIERRFSQVPRVLGDDARLGQLFRNLILNAVSAIPSGHADINRITLTTGTSTVQQVTQTIVEVADTGHVMNPDHARKLFSALFSSKPIDPSVGLGLAIAHRIVHSLGGRISARSEPGIGNVFRVELPSAPADVNLVQATAPQPDGIGTQSRRGRVLIIDDERLVLKTLARFFEPEHDTVTTTSASDALTLISEQGPFDLIFCDLMMPNTSGMKFLSMLRDKAPELTDKVVFMTGGAFDDEAQRFLDSVQNAHVAKPFDLQAVRTLVRQRINDNDRKLLPE